MARFSLRNKVKIEKAFDPSFYTLLMDSLKEHFLNHSEIEEHSYDNEEFKVIHVNSVQPNSDSTFEFYVIRKTFDVFNLAYKSVIG